MATMNSIDMLMSSRSLCCVNMKQIGDHRRDVLRADLQHVLDLLEEGKFKLDVSEERHWNEVGEMQKLMEDRKTTGKIVFVIPKKEEESNDSKEEKEGKEEGKEEQN
jgi:NADPH:quinone reductase-like Zn-dependent oxidoreductase